MTSGKELLLREGDGGELTSLELGGDRGSVKYLLRCSALEDIHSKLLGQNLASDIGNQASSDTSREEIGGG
jgi:hypothetical protein